MKDLSKTTPCCQDFFDRLDGMLSLEERSELAACKEEELSDYHFGLALWIRNNWIYQGDGSLRRVFSTEEPSGEEGFPGFLVQPYHADKLSSQVIEEYWQYLQAKAPRDAKGGD